MCCCQIQSLWAYRGMMHARLRWVSWNATTRWPMTGAMQAVKPPWASNRYRNGGFCGLHGRATSKTRSSKFSDLTLWPAAASSVANSRWLFMHPLNEADGFATLAVAESSRQRMKPFAGSRNICCQACRSELLFDRNLIYINQLKWK
jgi:hypothetical protein